MESVALKTQNLKPVILKAGVPLAASLAGLIYAWIIAKKNSSSKASSLSEIEPDSPQNICHQGPKDEESLDNFSFMDDEEPSTRMNSSVLSRGLVIRDNDNNKTSLEQEITSLRSHIEALQMRELALQLQFELFREMKEQESLFEEIKNMLSLEAARAEFLDREISTTEAETMRIENHIVQYLKVIEELECWKSENRVLQRKVQKLLRKSKAKSRLIKEQILKIKEKEEENLRNRDALQTRANVINKLEDEIIEMQRVLDQLQAEKNELTKKLDMAEAYASRLYEEKIHRKPLKYYLQVESGDVSKEDYNKVLNELEQVKKERESEVEELIHLRRTNDCLRYELMRRHEQQHQQQDQNRDHIEVDFEGSLGVMHYDSEHEMHHSHLEHHNVSCIGSARGNRACSKRRKLLRRLKRWVDGSEKVRVKPEIKRLDMHSVSYGSKIPEVPANARFCSSA